MIYNRTFVFDRPSVIPVFVELITGVEYPSRAEAETASHTAQFSLNCSVPGDPTTHVRVARSLEQFQELYRLRMAQQ